MAAHTDNVELQVYQGEGEDYVPITIFSMDETSDTFPEQTAKYGGVKNNVGIAASGGGPRALTLLVGYFRGLEKARLLNESCDYISSVSGGSWFSSLYTYASETDLELLGKTVEPESLTIEALKERLSPGKIGMTITKSFLEDAGEALLEGQFSWERIVEEVILDSFGLHRALFKPDKVAFPSSSTSDLKVVSPKKNRPFLIINATLEGPRGITTALNSSFQITPLYTGVPYYQNNATVSYMEENGFLCCTSQVPDPHKYIIGGGFISSYGFGSKEPRNPKDQYGNVANVMVKKPKHMLTLGKSIGYSSAAFAEELKNRAHHLLEDALDPTGHYWPISSSTKPSFNHPQKAHKFVIGDGGNFDNLGIMPLLQRKVKKIVAFINSATPVDMSYDAVKGSDNTSFPYVADSTLSCLYGVTPGKKKKSWDYTKNQVFSKTKYNDILADLQQSIRDGKGGVAKAKLEVISNSTWNIVGGWDVEVLFVYNEHCGNFVSRLPAETVAEINHGNEFKHFPHFKTTTQNGLEHFITYKKAQVNLLSAQAQVVVEENIALFQEFLSKN